MTFPGEETVREAGERSAVKRILFKEEVCLRGRKLSGEPVRKEKE